MSTVIDRFQETYGTEERARIYMAIYFTAFSSPEGYEQYKELVPLLRFGMRHDDEVQRYMKEEPAYDGFDFNADHLVDLLEGYNNEVRDASGQIYAPPEDEGIMDRLLGGGSGLSELTPEWARYVEEHGDLPEGIDARNLPEVSYVQQQDEDVFDPDTGELLYTIKAGTPAPLMPVDDIRHDLRNYMPFEEQFGFDPVPVVVAIAGVAALIKTGRTSATTGAAVRSGLKTTFGQPANPMLLDLWSKGAPLASAAEESTRTLFKSLLQAKSFQQAAGLVKTTHGKIPAPLYRAGAVTLRVGSGLWAGNLALQTSMAYLDPVGTGQWWQRAADEASDIWNKIENQEGGGYLPHEAEMLTSNDLAYVLTGRTTEQLEAGEQPVNYRDQQLSLDAAIRIEGVQAMAASGEEPEGAPPIPGTATPDTYLDAIQPEAPPEPVFTGAMEGDVALGSFQPTINAQGVDESVGGGYLGGDNIDEVMEFVPQFQEPEQAPPPGPAPHTPFVGEQYGLVGPDYKVRDTSKISPSPGLPRYGDMRPEDAENWDGSVGRRSQMQPRYNVDDYQREIQRMTPGQVQQFEEAAKAAGLLPDSHVADSMRDPAMVAAMEDVMYRANVAGNTWREILTTMGEEKATADAFNLQEWYNDFVPLSSYMKLDQATIDQTVKSSMREVLGREANQWEIDMFADGMRSDHRGDYDARVASEREVWNAQGRAQEFDDPQSVGEVQGIDEGARFNEAFEKQYDVEIDERERWQQMKTDSRNLFGGLSNISNMMGGLG